MSNKTISINPSLFSVGSSKSKKNRDKKTKPNAVPLISPSVLKNKLLKRIKEHKQKETQNLENNQRKLSTNDNIPVKSNNEINFTDEFTESINYLQTLSKQKHIDEEKRNSELFKQKQREELDRKTIRNHHSMAGQQINVDLPEELMQSVIPINTETFKINTRDDLPYGVLKGGIKPSYKEWARTQRNNIVTNPNSSLIVEHGNLSSEKSARENRLNLLKQKIQNKINIDPLITQNLIKRSYLSLFTQIQSDKKNAKSNKFEKLEEVTESLHIKINSIQTSLPIQTSIPTPIHTSIPTLPIRQENQEQNGGKIIATKHITKKTIKRKYTLGKSKIKKTVSVLIKDRGTRKRILIAQKDLKRRNINDIKTYLRDHNLIKTGSNAPNDVLRKIYESAMLSGEITNSNADILLHNFSKEEKELQINIYFEKIKFR